MKNDSHVVALIPLRGGSKGIPDKNIKEMCGKPLFYWSIFSAVNASYIDDVYVSTDSDKIKKLVLELFPQVKIIDRPNSLAKDESSTEDVLNHFAKLINFDINITIQATSPLIKSKDLDLALLEYFKNNHDSLLSVVKSKRFFWDKLASPINYDYKNRPRRQDFDGVLMENGAFYITSKKLLTQEECRLGGSIGMYEMGEDTAYEIDTITDWKVVEILLEENLKKRI